MADIFRATAEELGLNYEIVPVRTKEEYEAAIASGDMDIWMDQSGCYEDEGEVKYKLTDPYLTTDYVCPAHSRIVRQDRAVGDG